jgi:hypothetical protein
VDKGTDFQREQHAQTGRQSRCQKTGKEGPGRRSMKKEVQLYSYSGLDTAGSFKMTDGGIHT